MFSLGQWNRPAAGALCLAVAALLCSAVPANAVQRVVVGENFTQVG
jgi:hypothetical protein